MTSYPINFLSDRYDIQIHEGFAETANEAIAIVQGQRGNEWRVTDAELDTREIGHVMSSRAKIEKTWSEEIKAGWVSVIHVYGGYKGEATFWRTIEEEI